MKQLRDIRVAQILTGAKEIIANRWRKGAYVQDASGANKADFGMSFGIPDEDYDDWGYCGDGALRRAAKNAIKNWHEIERRSQGEALLHRAQKALSAPIERRLNASDISIPDRSHHKIWCFNDLPETTLDDMMACFDEAIEDACGKVKEGNE